MIIYLAPHILTEIFLYRFETASKWRKGGKEGEKRLISIVIDRVSIDFATHVKWLGGSWRLFMRLFFIINE
jgi:hypothetical protein